MSDLQSSFTTTYTCRSVNPFNMCPSDVSISDIAHQLSLTCRFGGATREFYSVAQHCLLVAHIVPATLALQALLHDAGEAYIGDIRKPLKNRMLITSAIDTDGRYSGEYLQTIEDRLLEVIYQALEVPVPTAVEKIMIDQADFAAYETEREDLFLDAAPILSRPRAIGRIRPLTPAQAKTAFLARYIELGGLMPDNGPNYQQKKRRTA